MNTEILHSPNSLTTLHGQHFQIPNLRPAFASWHQGINPHYPQLKQAVDARLAGLIGNEKVLAKIKAADIALFAAGWFPTAPYSPLETAAFYCVWLFLWDDAIDGSNCAISTDEDSVLSAEEYCLQSVAFVMYHLALDNGDGGGDGNGEKAPKAPTRVCESFGEVGRRVREGCGEMREGRGREEMVRLEGNLREYMEGCVEEWRARVGGEFPSMEKFWGWRPRTSGVDVMLDLSRILNGVVLPRGVLESKELVAMGSGVNRLLILINELFSLKKELKDGALGNLIPITMHSFGLDLREAVRSVVQAIHNCRRQFEDNSAALKATVIREHGGDAASKLGQVIEAYQAIATTVLNFSIESPRYGLLKDMQEDGSFLVTL